MPTEVWDGQRALTPRIVLDQDRAAARGLRFKFSTEQIVEPTDWCCRSGQLHLQARGR